MSIRRHQICAAVLLAIGCGGDATSTGVNPYANNPVPANAAAPPVQAVTRRSTLGNSGPRGSDVAEGEGGIAPQAIEVPEAGASAEMSVPLSFVEYAKFARQSAEMLAEMAKIHAAVSAEGEADAKQQNRWGLLTAQHTALARRVVEEAYPPADLVRELMPNAITKLHEELAHAKAVMEEFDELEGGLAQPYAQAERIFEHLTKNLPTSEVDALEAAASDETGSGGE